MTLSEYRQNQSWQGAMDLAPGLITLAEELPAAEEMGLSLQLRQLMVEIPAAVANDLMKGEDTRQTAVLKLVTALELIDRVYPALDTAATKSAADKLAEQLMSEDFASAPATSASEQPTLVPDNKPAAAPVTEPAASVDVVPTSQDAAPAAAPAEEPAVPTHVAVQPAASAENGETDVHPNSVQ